jgi:hypothetical protein
MGWWNQDKDGHSFAEGSDLIWGDEPADAMGSALDSILNDFVRDVGRRPTRAEVHAGLDFSLRGLGYLDDDSGDRPSTV